MRIHAQGGAARSAVISVPGDKSISHRGVILGSIATGRTTLERCLLGADVRSTISCFRAMGSDITVSGDSVEIVGVGPEGLRQPAHALDAGNAGTCMRLVSGVLAGQPFKSEFVGDESLSRRPMKRIIEPLEQMGAKITATARGTAPLHIEGRRPLKGIEYRLPVPSAQIKSAVLLAGLYADRKTTVVEPERVRDHTERMLSAFGAAVAREGDLVSVEPGALVGTAIVVPGDISSAAFFIVAAVLSTDCTLRIENVGLNPLRTGVIRILKAMGARIELENSRVVGGEEVGDVVVRSSSLHGIDVDPGLVSSAIDEFPILFVAAAFASGTTRVTGAAELRVKESDRIATMVRGLKAISVDAEATPDGAIIQGQASAVGGVSIDTEYDHRVAMAFAIASSRCEKPLVINDADAIATSFPTFLETCEAIGLGMVAME